ncbi:hypothetical protein AURDEDRAFT_161648 [Auricularia subglabra TFB-10046 SS5]|nr:hypothetical protein AURDEDRAFT_161648 [Auricularia subglabra TFB-10046 SS5]
MSTDTFMKVLSILETHLPRLSTLRIIFLAPDAPYHSLNHLYLLADTLSHPAPLLQTFSFTIKPRNVLDFQIPANLFGGYAPELRRLFEN